MSCLAEFHLTAGADLQIAATSQSGFSIKPLIIAKMCEMAKSKMDKMECNNKGTIPLRKSQYTIERNRAPKAMRCGRKTSFSTVLLLLL